MALIADRFLHNGTDQVLDLATGELAWLRMFAAGGPSDEARWLRRCARLASLRHPALAVLIDYGAIGEGRRFEVWQCEEAWNGARPEGELAVARTAAFLSSVGLSAGTALQPYRRATVPVCMPCDASGYEACDPAPPPTFDIAETGNYGLELLPRAFSRLLDERVAAMDLRSPRVFSLWAPAGAGRRTAMLEIARCLRQHGIVPLALDAFAHRDAIGGGRSVALLAIGDAISAWHAYLDLSLASRRPHLLVVAGDDATSQAHSLPLERFTTEQLVSAVRPEPAAAAKRELIVLAQRADGWPARFARRLFATDASAPQPKTALRASEERSSYVVERPVPASQPEPRPWPISADVVLLRQRLREAVTQYDAGLHVRGERLVRQALGGLSRRADWSSAAEGALSLARGLLGRGRWRDAMALLDDARRFAARANQPRLQLAISALVGRAELDALHLDEAETVLESALAACRAIGDLDAEIVLRLELSRCLFWRGRYETAAAVISCPEPPASAAARVAMAQARIALGRGQVAEAVAAAMAAVAMAEKSTSAAQRASAAAIAALAHLCVGDHAALQRDLESGLSASRAAHAPLIALRLRLLQAESWRRSGQRGGAFRLIQRLRQRGTRQIPPILRARLELIECLLKDEGADTALRLATTSGLMSLTLYAPKPHADGPRASMRHLIEILRCCQSAEDDAQLLKTLVSRLKEALQASAIAIFADDRGQLTPVASDGARLDREAAERVRVLGDAVGPRPGSPVADGGVPVRYGDRVVGVIAVRWPKPDRCNAGECLELLTTAAVAAGPALAAEQAKRQQKAVGISELVGSSEPMERVRAAIERAAPAPFSVLIEGESGTGKELVAKAIHRRSTRRERTCCTVNCAALPDDLVESELFGHARGAFTGAMAERPGVFDEANGGTLFLDEIGELSLRAQAKVLRAIQEGEVRRVGENTPRRVDVRIIAATNRDLRQEVAAGRFRLDLLYRLDVIRIAVPPLRDRVDDLPLLVEHFWRDATARIGSRATLSVTTIGALARYHWPGNVRELQNVLAALAVRCPRRGIVPASALPGIFDARQPERSCRLDAARRTFEASFVRAALARAGGHRLRAAEELGVTRQGLAKLITRLGLADNAVAAAGD